MRIKQSATQIIETHEMASSIPYPFIISVGEYYKPLRLILKIKIIRKYFMKNDTTEKQLLSTPGNAKHKSRHVKKKNGDTSSENTQDKR